MIGVSISAPILFIIIGEIFTKRAGLSYRPLHPWRGIILTLAFGMIFSYLMSSLILAETEISAGDFLLLLRYLFWLVVFCAVTILVAHLNDPESLVRVLGWGAVCLGALWFFDRLDPIGLESALLTPNTYGFQFSTFWPFALILLQVSRRRLIAGVGVGVLALAIVLNGSRGAWVAVGLETLVLLTAMLRYQLVSARAATILVLAMAGTWIGFNTTTLSEHARGKADQFMNLERDKSWAIRQIMVQKGLALFRANPLVGVGPGRFTRVTVGLDSSLYPGRVSQDSLNRRSAHNSYIDILAETGIVGSIPYFFLLFVLTLRGARSAYRLIGWGRAWGLAVVASFLGMSAHMWVIAAQTGTHVWLMYGVCAGVTAWTKARLSAPLRVRV